MRKIALLPLIVLFVNCKEHPAQPTDLVADQAMVVSARAEASQIGVEIMKKGGNAFDAMVATELALAVAYPVAGNLGGGGFIVYRKANGEIGGLDFREKAPLAAHRDMYLDSLGDVIPDMSTLGATAVGVPGTVAGVMEVHEKLGSLPLDQIMEPVIALARNGVVVTQKQARTLKAYRETFIKVNGDSTKFAGVFNEGDTIKYPALANTLTKIMEEGKDGFYKGEVAQKLAAFIQAKGGLITEEDLANYQAKWRTPITFDYRDLQFISMSPPSSGGVTINQIFKFLEPHDVSGFGHNSTKTIQLYTEAARRAYADRNHFLGDPDFVEIPLEELLDDAYLQERMADFSFDRASLSSEIGHGSVTFAESEQTTHYSIVDPQGNAVSATTTLNGGFGSKLFSDELGFFLNNEMDDFSAKPGVPNMFGLVGDEANSIAPGKRMLSSMTPTIVVRDASLYLVVGTPGGSTIMNSVAQTILNVHEFNMSMQDAVNAPRFHHQWLPDEIVFEGAGFSEELKQELEAKGYTINRDRKGNIGRVDAIRVLPDGRLEGGADRRGDDTAVGF